MTWKRNRKLAVAAVLCGVTAAACLWLAQRSFAAPGPSLAAFPRELGPWSGCDVALSERQYGLLETENVLFREYTDAASGAEVLACVAVAGGNRKVAHPPAICYRGQGWSVLAERELDWRIGGETRRIQELHIQKDHRDVLVLSWYRVGTRSTASYFRQQWLGLWADLMGSELPSALFRFSAPLDPERLEEARSTLRDFIDRAVPLLEETLERPAEAPRAS